MRACDVPIPSGYTPQILSLAELQDRTRNNRAHWTDLPNEPGIYVVYCRVNQQLHCVSRSNTAIHAEPTSCELLQSKWRRICARAPTDIIYIGKGHSIRNRVRALIRFGVGLAGNHAGGEWMWQIEEVATAKVLIQTCPEGAQLGFENWLLERYQKEHGEVPLANREGPQGDVRWTP